MVNYGKTYSNNIINDWKQYYLDYNKLKEISSRDIIDNNNYIDIDNFLDKELDKVNNFYNEQINIINDKFNTLDTEHIYHHCDKLRQYVLLNTISVIKFIKRRNKRISDTISTIDILKNYDFYNNIELNNIYRKLLELISLEDNNLTMKFSLNTLNNIRKDTNFKDYNLLPRYTCDEYENEDFINYLNNKLGPNNIVNNLEISNHIKLNELKEFTLLDRFMYFMYLMLLLYFFIFGLDLMSNSFKALSGKNVGLFFSYINNPIAGLMVGIIVTVFLQSSSTTTSIIVTMVGSDIINVETAIPLIMGANIGTSITNTLVSYGHINDKEEYKLAFTGAIIHDIFNYLSVMILLPIEILTRLIGFPLLFSVSKGFTNIFLGVNSLTFKSPLKIIVKPFIEKFLSVDKDVIKAYATGCIECGNVTNYCWDLDKEYCLSQYEWDEEYSQVIDGGFLMKLGDKVGGFIGLSIALIVLCISLYNIVKTLHKQVMYNRGKGKVLSIVKKSLSISPYLTMFVGMVLTMSVQSSSIITSTFTPLVGLSILTVEQMFPLTLGANIGTTFTAFLASLVTESTNAIQIAICHLLFNIIGITIWYPIPYIRKLPLSISYNLGNLLYKYNWFSLFYIFYTFLIFPVICWFISFIFNINTTGIILGSLLFIIYFISSFLLFYNFENIIHKMNIKKIELDEP